MIIIFIVFTTLWSLLVIWLMAGWQKAVQSPVSGVQVSVTSPESVQVAVVIAVRNEEKHIGMLLDDLLMQTSLPAQIIVVDDHSADNTRSIVMSKAAVSDTITLLEVTEGEGKKNALTLGINHATVPVIATTDGDCRVHPSWVDSIQRAFFDDCLKMLSGGVRIRQDDTLFSALQAMEFASLIGSGAATLALGIPVMCNGANLAFRKEAFEQAGGYGDNNHVPTGDDVFLLRRIFSHDPRSVRFNAFPESVTETEPASTLSEFVHQRIRWASKWNLHPKPDSALLAAFVFFAHLSITGLWLSLILKPESAPIVLAFLFLRALSEFFFLRKVMYFTDSPWRWSAFIILQVVYSFYVIIVAILANTRSYRWKGRNFR